MELEVQLLDRESDFITTICDADKMLVASEEYRNFYRSGATVEKVLQHYDWMQEYGDLVDSVNTKLTLFMAKNRAEV
ncbi:gp32.8 [Bacillus phage SPO1]|uniref:Gp32.8 n=1 Tax=Bacillus phage SP01 TaxID=2884427 RepID=B6V2K5_BPSP1|nr:gp32.8 [Bacillus phage SPO1]ACI91054.1 gp32.8 [Bacillus phage SPO1]